MSEHLFDEMKRYVGFDADDEVQLRAAGEALAPHLEGIIDVFYDRIEEHPEALAVVERFSSIDRLKGTLVVWIQQFFAGPWDLAYYEQRERIGRRHVQIGLGHQYMIAAMHVIERRIIELLEAESIDDATRRVRIRAVNRLVAIELIIMMHTFFEDFVSERERRERLATFGLLTSTIAHELRNPLAVIDTSLYLLKEQVAGADDALRHVDKIQTQVRRSNRIITSLLDLVRDKPSRPRAVSAADLAEQARAALSEERGTDVTCEVAAALPQVLVDPDQVQQVLSNLLGNAVDAAGPDGEVRLEVRRVGDWVRFVVSDSGAGVDASIADRLFQPLVTTKSHGSGLGLALCKKLAEANGGRVVLGKGSLAGAAFELDLPLADD